MKKLLTLMTFLLLLTSMKVSANQDLFSYDQEKINSEMAELVRLENYISANDQQSVAEILSAGNIAPMVSLSNPNAPAFGVDDVEWGSFTWGFCCWPIGLFTVIFNDSKDKNHKISFFAGLVTSAVLGAVGRVAYNILYITSY